MSIDEWLEYINERKADAGVTMVVPTEDFLALVNDFKQVSESNLKRKCQIASLMAKAFPDKWDFCVCKAKRCIHSEDCTDSCPNSKRCSHSIQAYKKGLEAPPCDLYERYEGAIIKHSDGRWTKLAPKLKEIFNESQRNV